MDFFKFFDVGHRDHHVCNPTSEAALDALVEILALDADARVLDVGCGKAEPLLRIVQRHGCRGVGVDLSEGFLREARAKVEAAGLADRIEIVHGDAADYEAPEGSFDLAVCMGASWIFGGHEGTLRALSRWTREGGLVVAGEPYWYDGCPTPEYAQASGYGPDAFGSHRANVETGLAQGLALLHTFVSARQDFDRYEGLQWNAVERYAAEQPDDPDVPELLTRVRQERDLYLRWGRDELGWAIYVFARSGTMAPPPPRRPEETR
ncbi:MAG: SAM-dependent methyltransferase [Myxococcota bacterium]